MESVGINATISLKIATEYGLFGILRLTYEAIRSFKCNNEHTAYPSISTIARTIGRYRTSTKKYIRKLEEIGVISVTERPVVLKSGKSWNDTHLYTFVAEKFNKAKSFKRSVEKQTESGYDKKKRQLKEANCEIELKYGPLIANEALTAALKNLRKGYTIIYPSNYLETIAKDLKANKEICKLADDPEMIELIESKTKYVSVKKKKFIPRKKNEFHNFEQRSSTYSKDEMNKLIQSRQKSK